MKIDVKMHIGSMKSRRDALVVMIYERLRLSVLVMASCTPIDDI